MKNTYEIEYRDVVDADSVDEAITIWFKSLKENNDMIKVRQLNESRN
jgi:hypothetical protein